MAGNETMKVALASFGMLLSGYERALERLLTAVDQQEELPVFHALFEVLEWAVSIDEAVGAWWAPAGETLGRAWRDRVEGAELLEGVGYARNAVHHLWAQAVHIDPSGRRYPRSYSQRYYELMWRPRDEMPIPRSGSPEMYDQMAQAPVDATLVDIGKVFERLGALLEIPRR